MSSNSNLIQLLSLIQKSIYSIGGPILVFLGSVSCLFNLIIFNQKNLRKNPCSICFSAFNISSFLLLYLSLLPTIIEIGYNVEMGTYNLIYCRLRLYFSFLLACLPPFYLILAAIERTMITSANARIRQWSNRSFILKCLFSLTLFWILFHIHALFYTTVLQIEPNHFYCHIQLGLYSVLVSYYGLIVIGLIPIVLLSTFGWLTWRNLHTSPNRINVIIQPRNENRIQDRQLIRMLSVEIFTFMIFYFLQSSVLLYQQITQYQNKSETSIAIEQFFFNISILSLNIPPCISFYTNLMASKTFRKEIKKLFFKNHVHPQV